MAENQTQVVILQHPQEKEDPLNTAKMVTDSLENSKLEVGFSRPNFAKATGAPREETSEWAVLYLGTGLKLPKPHRENDQLFEVIKKDKIVEVTESVSPPLKGLIALDGNWKQSKVLWWRNPWLLKLRRFVVQGHRPSIYNKVKREPRREAMSTLEAVSIVLKKNGDAEAAESLLANLAQAIS